MNLRPLVISVFVAGMVVSTAATPQPFVGVKLAPLEVEGSEPDDPLNLAVNFGYALDTWVADLSLVAELNYTVEDGRTYQDQDLQLNSNAVYVLWKTTRSMYVSLRAGAVQNELVEGSDSSYKTGLIVGASIGQVVGRTRVQIEYTSLAGDASFYGISLEFDL